MIGFPFDSQVTYESDGTPVYDRAISSAPLRELIKKMLTNGVLPNPSTNLQVQSGTGMTVVVNPGFAVIEGGLKYEETQRTLVVQASDATYDRIDTVVMRWNDNPNARNCDLYVVQGAPASTPVRPELNRSSSVYEIGLADLFVAAGSSAISMARITDTRYEAERCGIISSIAKFDSDAIYRQVQADLAGFKENEQAEFLTWFEMIRGQLSEDAAGNLQNQMEDMRNSMGDLNDLETTNKSSVVAAMNELFNMSPETVDPMAATMPGMAADALAVKEQFSEQNKKIDKMPQFEFGMHVSSGATQTITLKNNYTSMHYFDVSLLSQENAYIPRSINFIAPNKVTFECVAGSDYIKDGTGFRYIFIGE